MDERIAAAASSLSNAGGLKAEVLASRFESAQTAWRLETDEKCSRDDVVVRELCRLSALNARESELSLELDAAMRQYGY